MVAATALSQYGLPLVYVTVFLDQAGLPIPSLPLLAACGALVASGELSWAPLLVTSTLASLTADVAWYSLGRWQGRRVLGLFRRFSLHTEESWARWEVSARRHGVVSVAVAKFLPGLQTVAPPLAGVMGLPLKRFALVSSFSGLVWSAGTVTIGWVFRDSIGEATRWIEDLGARALVPVGLFLAGYAAILAWRRRRGLRESNAGD